MAITIKSTRSISHESGVKVLVYGQAGAGKTSLIPTLPAPIVLSAEGGLLSVREHDLPYIEIGSMEDLREVYRFLRDSHDAREYKSVAIDSLSEVAEVVLANEKRNTKDSRQAYMAMQDLVHDLIRAFRDLPERHVYASAKLEKAQDEMGRILYSPSMPGQKTGQALPYFFDEVLALRVERDAEGTPHRELLCQPDGLWTAKDRSGKLDTWEPPDLGVVIAKITGGSSK